MGRYRVASFIGFALAVGWLVLGVAHRSDAASGGLHGDPGRPVVPPVLDGGPQPFPELGAVAHQLAVGIAVVLTVAFLGSVLVVWHRLGALRHASRSGYRGMDARRRGAAGPAGLRAPGQHMGR